jgi:thioredoxin-related protein
VDAERPLLVLFDGGDCPERLQLRSQVLAYPPVRELLADYDAARLDWMDADTPLMTPAGEQSSPAAWAARLRIARVPTLVFFDEAGEEVFRLDSLVLRQRMERALRYVLEKAYLQGKTYQQFTREKTIEKLKAQRAPAAAGD